MKKLITVMACIAIGITAYSGNDKDKANKLNIEGDFLSQQNVIYEIYSAHDDSTYIEIECHQEKRSFELSLVTDQKYLIKFIAPDGKTKYLHVDAVEPGTFQIDVDFSSERSAQMFYSHKRLEYYVLGIATPVKDINYAQR